MQTKHKLNNTADAHSTNKIITTENTEYEKCCGNKRHTPNHALRSYDFSKQSIEKIIHLCRAQDITG